MNKVAVAFVGALLLGASGCGEVGAGGGNYPAMCHSFDRMKQDFENKDFNDLDPAIQAFLEAGIRHSMGIGNETMQHAVEDFAKALDARDVEAVNHYMDYFNEVCSDWYQGDGGFP